MSITDELQKKLQGLPQEGLVDVVLELAGAEGSPAAGSRAERVAELKQAFSQAVEPVEAAIGKAGGEVLDRLWLANSVRARVPVRAIPQLSQLDRVIRLDSTHPITADASLPSGENR